MVWLILGLMLFLGVHSVRIVAEGWRTAMRARLGEGPWKGLYSLASIAGFTLIVQGFGQARLDPQVLWVPPVAMRHIAALLVLIAFVFLAAAYVPRNGTAAGTLLAVAVGVAAWAGFAFWGHRWLIGVAPLAH